MYYRGSLGALLIFDLTSLSSFEHLPQWIEEIRANVQNDIPLLLVGNKSDLIDERAVSIEEVNDFTNKFNLYYMETSAKTGEGVGDCFYILACLMMGEVVPGNLISEEVVFNPGNITIESSPSPQISETEDGTDYYAPPVPEPMPSFQPEPEVQYEVPPVPEPEPEPEIRYETPTLPKPIPIKAPEPMTLFEPTKEKTQGKSVEEHKPFFTPAPKPPQSEVYKPKAVPFTSSTPVPASPPNGFQDSQDIKPSDVIIPSNIPFISSKEPDLIKSTEDSTPSEKTTETIPFFAVSQTKESGMNSTIDSTTETTVSKKDKKKQGKLKKREAKEKAKVEKLKEKEAVKFEKERKLQEAKEKQEKLIEDMKKVKSDKTLIPEQVDSIESKPHMPFQATVSKKEPSESPSLFKTLTKKPEETQEPTEDSFIPFAAEKKKQIETSTELRIIPNVEDFKSPTSVSEVTPSAPTFQTSETQPKRKDLIICKQCGAILSSDYTFCNKCGYQL